jgi:hypothetical protein
VMVRVDDRQAGIENRLIPPVVALSRSIAHKDIPARRRVGPCPVRAQTIP